MKKIAFVRPDGGVSILTPAPRDRVAKVVPEVAGMTDDEYLEWIKNRDVPKDAVDVTILDESEIPADRTHRDAWIKKGNKIEIDTQKIQQEPTEQKKKEALLKKLRITESEAKLLKEI